ncbi:hypothetical protein FBU30_005373 [Linnemannia zychae]|nr:hypothetical protein FBU30_005373 [Linnemannia zychae]
MAALIPLRRTASNLVIKAQFAPYTTHSKGAAFLNTLEFLTPAPSQPRSTQPSNSSNFRPNGNNKSSNREFLRNSASANNGFFDGLDLKVSGNKSSPPGTHANVHKSPLKRAPPHGSAAGGNAPKSDSDGERRRAPPPLDRPRRDEEIDSQWVQFIGLEGNQGEKRLTHVLRTIDRSKYFLVEVDPNARPPICKLFSKKELYEKSKASKQAKKANEISTKELQLNWGTDSHDLEHKLAKCKAFLEKGYRLDVQINGKKGRTTTQQDRDLVFERVKNEFEPISKYVKKPEWIKATTVTMLLQGTPAKPEKQKKQQKQDTQQE